MFEATSDYGIDTGKQRCECADYDSNGLPEFHHSPTLRQTSRSRKALGQGAFASGGTTATSRVIFKRAGWIVGVHIR
jgi:hypothetical protein